MPIKESMIYHRPGQQSHNKTRAEECFAYGSDAEASDYRAAKRQSPLIRVGRESEPTFPTHISGLRIDLSAGIG